MIVDLDILDRIIERCWLRSTDGMAFPEATAEVDDLEAFAKDVFRMGFLAALTLVEERARVRREASA